RRGGGDVHRRELRRLLGQREVHRRRLAERDADRLLCLRREADAADRDAIVVADFETRNEIAAVGARAAADAQPCFTIDDLHLYVADALASAADDAATDAAGGRLRRERQTRQGERRGGDDAAQRPT